MPVLTVDRCTKPFGGVKAVAGVSLQVEAGSVTALIGPNGAGKTTLFNCITGFEVPSEGRISLAGRRINGKPAWKIARDGMVRTFQTPTGFPKLSVWENVMVGGAGEKSESLMAAVLGRRAWITSERETNDRAEGVLRELDLWEHRDTPLEEMSAGQTKLVEFARQLMAEPKVLLLDEPASGVDPSRIGRLSALIRNINDRGITVFVIDHNLAFVLGIADYVYVLAQGHLLASGTPNEISRDPQVIETYLGAGI